MPLAILLQSPSCSLKIATNAFFVSVLMKDLKVFKQGDEDLSAILFDLALLKIESLRFLCPCELKYELKSKSESKFVW